MAAGDAGAGAPRDQRTRRLDRLVDPDWPLPPAPPRRTLPVIAVMGDGTFGFHMAEFDTAVRCNLPFVAVVGNDATWNAEHQIQLREYGPNRTHGCELLPSRYDLVVQALGGHGELVTSAADLPAALDRAIASGKPACVNVMIERVPAPVIRRAGVRLEPCVSSRALCPGSICQLAPALVDGWIPVTSTGMTPWVIGRARPNLLSAPAPARRRPRCARSAGRPSGSAPGRQ